CSRDKWGYVNLADLSMEDYGGLDGLQNTCEFANGYVTECTSPDSSYFCKTSDLLVEKHLCLNDETIYTECLENGQPQCTDIDPNYDHNLKSIWAEMKKNVNYDDSYISPAFKTKVSTDECVC
ncbi:MAG: hypothetical protein MHPSP_003076, partial [Paramarteilia canceri]